MRVGETQGQAHAQVLALAPGVVPTALALDPAAGFLLSRVDGHTSWGTLRQIGALPSHEIDRWIERWLKEGVLVSSAVSSISTPRANGSKAAGAEQRVQSDGAATAKPAAAKPPPTKPAQSTAAPAPTTAQSKELALPALDASLDLDLELQREILDFARGLGRRYHEILGVNVDADARVVKKAYFGLSKKLHPDRYFRRNTGAFGAVIEGCFKRLLEAYELLSDPTTRKEVQQHEAAPIFAPIVNAGAASSARASSIDARRRLRERVSSMAGHARAHQERRRKAKSFFEHGMASFAGAKWLEAAGAVRLAIAFDPENASYREEFPNVQRKAHEERAKFFVKQGEGALEMRDYAAALDYFEEALHFRPADAELAFRAAKLSLQASGDLKRTKEFAAQAVDVAPDNAAYRRMLADVYAAAGLNANAKREYEAALRIDPDDREAKSALRSLR
jgi:curved DNA-binding protein CbpA